jgi:hypothetical protein
MEIPCPRRNSLQEDVLQKMVALISSRMFTKSEMEQET